MCTVFILRLLSNLPITRSSFIAFPQMLLFAAIFGCLSPALTIAAALAYKDPFVLPIDKKNMADEAKRAFAGDSCR